MSFAVGTSIYLMFLDIFLLKQPLDTPNIPQTTSTNESQIVLDA